ncbi:MAG: hypothetical protein R2771_12050 [Saprospiraceae bacterium]
MEATNSSPVCEGDSVFLCPTIAGHQWVGLDGFTSEDQNLKVLGIKEHILNVTTMKCGSLSFSTMQRLKANLELLL